jgi:D-glycero-alpha-D-manno-heptose 1-phosphate guanylyltransferase
MRTCDAIVLAGGLGKRLRPVVPHLPKPLALIKGRPFLDILLAFIESQAVIGNIILALGYQAEMIIAHYQDKKYFFSIEREPLGTGGAILHALSYVSSAELFVFNGDSLCSCSLEAMLNSHSTPLTIACADVLDTDNYGRVEIQMDGKITRFSEKGSSGGGLVNAGIYLFDHAIFREEFPPSFSLEYQLLPRLVAQGKVTAFRCGNPLIDIGTKRSYLQAQSLLTQDFWQ